MPNIPSAASLITFVKNYAIDPAALVKGRTNRLALAWFLSIIARLPGTGGDQKFATVSPPRTFTDEAHKTKMARLDITVAGERAFRLLWRSPALRNMSFAGRPYLPDNCWAKSKMFENVGPISSNSAIRERSSISDYRFSDILPYSIYQTI